jgi:hypothetical protein
MRTLYRLRFYCAALGLWVRSLFLPTISYRCVYTNPILGRDVKYGPGQEELANLVTRQIHQYAAYA